MKAIKKIAEQIRAELGWVVYQYIHAGFYPRAEHHRLAAGHTPDRSAHCRGKLGHHAAYRRPVEAPERCFIEAEYLLEFDRVFVGGL